MIQSNDGGANVSTRRRRDLEHATNQPTAEIYQVAVDSQYPVPRVRRAAGRQHAHRARPFARQTGRTGAAGRAAKPVPIIPNIDAPDTVYGGCKGQFSRLNLKTANEQQYWVGGQSLYGNGGATLIYRFQRVSPMEVSPFDQNTVYYGSQYVHRSRDEGANWQRISPDLTWNPARRAAGSQRHPDHPRRHGRGGVQHALRHSRVAGAAGRHLDRVERRRRGRDADDGKTWSRVTPPGLQPGGRVQNIEPDPHHAGTAYVAIYRYLLGDFAPYIYRTDDFGKTWTLLTNGTNGIPANTPTRVVRVDPDRAGLLYAGTEFGMYVSFDNGAHWQSFQMNLPITPVTDIKVAHDALVISTQGRSFWVLDNLTPLHQLNARVAAAPAYLFKPEPAIRHGGRGGFGGFGRGAGPEYPAPGAEIDYYIGKPPAGDITLSVLDAAGNVVRSFSSEAPAEGRGGRGGRGGGGGGGFRGRGGPARLDNSVGMHRFTWDLRYPGPWESASRPDGGNGPAAVPGTYSVRLTVGAYTSTQPLTVVEDPRITRDGITTAILRTQFAHNVKVRQLVSDVNHLVARVEAAQRRLRGATGAAADTLAKVNALAEKLHHLEHPLQRAQTPDPHHLPVRHDQRRGPEDQQRRRLPVRHAAQGTGRQGEGGGRNSGKSVTARGPSPRAAGPRPHRRLRLDDTRRTV